MPIVPDERAFGRARTHLKLCPHDLNMLCIAALAAGTEKDGVRQLLELMLFHAYTNRMWSCGEDRTPMHAKKDSAQ